MRETRWACTCWIQTHSFFFRSATRLSAVSFVQADDELAVTVISVEEQLSGWYTLVRRAKNTSQLSRAYQRLADTVHMLGCFPVLSFTEAAISRIAQLKS